MPSREHHLRPTGWFRRLRADHDAWRALGDGGLPANVVGWSISCTLQLSARETRSTAPYGPVDPGPPWLPRRVGSRPTLGRHPVPHRQLDQLAPVGVRLRPADLVDDLTRADPSRLHGATSRFERRGPAVFVTSSADAPARVRAARGEVAHVHARDGSLHVLLGPADAGAVITAGWGERHPLAGARGLGLPDTYLLVYAPRDDAEVAVVRRIVDRAVAAALAP